MDVQQFIAESKVMNLQQLRERYTAVVGEEPPPTQSMNWLFHRVNYRFQVDNYWEDVVHPLVMERHHLWENTPTPEQELMDGYKKLKKSDLQKLCEQEGIIYKGKKRVDIIRELAFAVAGVEFIYEPRKAVALGDRAPNQPGLPQNARRPRRRNGSATRVRQDSLPDSIEALLVLKRTANRDMQRQIRRKLRSIDPNWNKKRTK